MAGHGPGSCGFSEEAISRRLRELEYKFRKLDKTIDEITDEVRKLKQNKANKLSIINRRTE